MRVAMRAAIATCFACIAFFGHIGWRTDSVDTDSVDKLPHNGLMPPLQTCDSPCLIVELMLSSS